MHYQGSFFLSYTLRAWTSQVSAFSKVRQKFKIYSAVQLLFWNWGVKDVVLAI